MATPYETKIVGATGGALTGVVVAPLVVWLFTLIGVDIPPEAADVVAQILIGAFGVLGAFLGGYFKKSTTSTVSVAYTPPEPPPDPNVPYQPQPPGLP